MVFRVLIYAVLGFIVASGGFYLGFLEGKGKGKVVVAAKRVDNRVLPNYTRAERRAYKRRRRDR